MTTAPVVVQVPSQAGPTGRAPALAPQPRLLGAVAGRAVTPEDLRDAGRLRAHVYVDEKGWLSPSVLVDGCEVDADDARAIPLLVRTADGTAIATFRALLRDGAPLPVERHAGVSLDPSRRAVECSRLVVHPSWRGGGSVLLALCRLVVSVAEEIGAQDLWALIESPLLAKLHVLGFPFVPVADPVRAYHTDNVAAVMHLEDLPAGLARHQQRHGCALADWFSEPFDGTVRAGGLCGER